jgi:PilZ domain
MGKRREPRKEVQVPVRIFGTDAQGKIFSENVTTVSVSHSGASLTGVRSQLKIDEILGLTHGANKVHFRVKWLGAPGTPSEGSVGLLNLTPERPLWGFLLPSPIMDNFRGGPRADRRLFPRVKCAVSVELRGAGQATAWAKAADLSLGGCFVEMAIPLKQSTNIEITLWLGETKLKLKGSVASSSPGFGIGVKFTGVRETDRKLLGAFLPTLAKGC